MKSSLPAIRRRVRSITRVGSLAARDGDGRALHLALATLRTDEAAAADFFSRSGALARKQGALAWELRAAINLGKLWATQSRERDALDLLEPLYGRFTEGFETADLIAARRLIDELRSSASTR